MDFPQPRDRAWNTGGPVPDQAGVGDVVALRIEVHIAARTPGCGFAKVEEAVRSLVMQGDETAAAQISGFGIGDREHEGGSDGCIDGVAALAQYSLGDFSAMIIGNRDGRRRAAQRRGQQHVEE